MVVCCSLAHLFCHHQQFLVDGKIVPTILTSWKKVGCGLYSSRPRRPQEARAVWLASAELIRPPSTSGSLKKPPKSVHVQSSIAAGLPPFLPLYESDKRKKNRTCTLFFRIQILLKIYFGTRISIERRGRVPGRWLWKGIFHLRDFKPSCGGGLFTFHYEKMSSIFIRQNLRIWAGKVGALS